MSEVMPYQPTGEELEEVKVVQDLSPYLLDPTVEFSPVEYTLSINGVGFAPMGDLHVVKAPQKNGKTFLLTILMGALLRGEYMGISCELEKARVLFIDTEQHPRNTQLVYRRVCMIAGIDGHKRHDNFRVYHMRGAQVEEIRHAILQEVVFFKPNVVVVDGLVDCVIDPNDQAESKGYITALSALAMKHNVSMWTVLHTNPGTDKMRGHLGTILSQKVSDVLMVKKEKQIDGSTAFTVSQTDTRNKDLGEFSFCIEDRKDDNGEWIAMPVATYVSSDEMQHLDEVMKDALADGPLRFTDLLNKVMSNEKVKQTKAKGLINDARGCGIIAQDTVMHKYSYYGIPAPKNDDMPF